MGIAGMRTGRVGVGMQIDRNLCMEMFAGVEMGGFEIGAQAVDQSGGKRRFLLQQQMAIIALHARIGFEPIFHRRDWWLARMHSSPGRSPLHVSASAARLKRAHPMPAERGVALESSYMMSHITSRLRTEK